MRTSPARGEMLAAGLALLVGIGALFGTRGMSNLGSVFPTVAASVMIVTALAVLARALLRRPAAGAPPEPLPDGALVRFAGASLVLLGWALALKPLGFLVSGALGLAAFGLLAWRERMSPMALGAHIVAGAVMLGGFYMVMTSVLRLSVP